MAFLAGAGSAAQPLPLTSSFQSLVPTAILIPGILRGAPDPRAPNPTTVLNYKAAGSRLHRCPHM